MNYLEWLNIYKLILKLLIINIKNKNHTLNGARLDLLTSSTSFYLSLTLCLKDSISAKRTTINAMCSLILLCNAA
jgi:hypothetical protein